MDRQAELGDESGIHLHCQECFSSSCNVHPRCPVVHCASDCGIKYHACKAKEHSYVCRKFIRPCINSHYGCPFKVDSITITSHLEVCPASVVHCGMSWNRYPLYSKVRQSWIPFQEGNPVQVNGDLDTEMAIADQQSLRLSLKARMRRGSKNVCLKRKANPRIGQISSERITQLRALVASVPSRGDSIGSSFAAPKAVVSLPSPASIGVDDLRMASESVDTNIDPADADVEDAASHNVFMAYDELESVASVGAATVVTNYSIRDAYYDLPNKYSDYEHRFKYSKDAIITRDGARRMVEEEPGIASKVEDVGVSREPCSNADSSGHKYLEKMAVHCKLSLNFEPLGLNVVLETLPKFQQQYPMYSFSCSKLFRRDQFKWHYKNVHSEIHAGLNGWMAERCPLAHYGCPFVTHRLRPVSQHGSVFFNKQFNCFGVKFGVPTVPDAAVDASDGTSANSLLDLPVELLEVIASFLDNLSLNCVAKTCHALRTIASAFLDRRGIVVLSWKKKNYPNGSSSWKEGHMVRTFTSATSPVRNWVYSDEPSIGSHMQTCCFFHRHTREEPVNLELDKVANIRLSNAWRESTESL